MLPTLLLMLAAPPADWPSFRGANGDGDAGSAAIPTKWSDTENVRWKVPVKGKGWASPLILGDQVWLSSATEDGKQKFALGFDRATGKLLHDVELFPEAKPAFSHAFNSYASCTGALEPGRFYAHFGSHGTACLDTATGKILWTRDDFKCDHWRGPASSVALHGDRLFLLFDGHDLQYVVALNKRTGETLWKTDRDIKYSRDDGDLKKAYATPKLIAANGREELICPAAESTISYDPATGKELWRVNHGGMNGSARPLFVDGVLYLTSGHNQNLLAVKPGGEVLWKQTREVPTRPSLVAANGLLFMVDDKGLARCLDAKTGREKWKERLGGEYSASPIHANGNIYFCDQDGRTHVVAAADTFTSVGTNRLPGGFMASPSVAGDVLFLRTRTHLYAIANQGR